MTHLSEDATYRTRDGFRKGIRVRRCHPSRAHPWSFADESLDASGWGWTDKGRYLAMFSGGEVDHLLDLIEETPSTPPLFSYEACPVGKDGRRRAVTRGGNDVVLLCGDRNGDYPIVGYIEGRAPSAWRANGRVHSEVEHPGDLLLPTPSKRTVWVNLMPAPDNVSGVAAIACNSQEEAEQMRLTGRLGNRAYRIEIDEATA